MAYFVTSGAVYDTPLPDGIILESEALPATSVVKTWKTAEISIGKIKQIHNCNTTKITNNNVYNKNLLNISLKLHQDTKAKIFIGKGQKLKKGNQLGFTQNLL